MINLSICIPTYNRAGYLKRCIQSILDDSDDSDVEILIQDNCSPDCTQSVVREFTDQRIRYIRNSENIGIAKNIISIIKKARGAYVFVLTDDDYIMPGAIEKIKRFIARGVDYFTSDMTVFLEKQNRSYLYSYSSKDLICDRNDAKENINIFLSSHVLSRCCFRKDLVNLDMLEQGGDNWYPEMHVFLQCFINRGVIGYLAETTITHTWENEVYWGVEPLNREVLHQGEVNIVLSVSDRLPERFLTELILHYSLEEGRIHPDFLRVLSAPNRVGIENALRKKKIEKYLYQRLDRPFNYDFIKRRLAQILSGKRGFVVFGAGEDGINCFTWLKERSAPVLYFVDNASSKQNRQVEDLTVRKPEALIGDQVITIITRGTYQEEIARQLERMGFRLGEDYELFEQLRERLLCDYIHLRLAASWLKQK